MNKALIVFAAVVAAVTAQYAGAGPSVPYGGYSAADCFDENTMFADAENMCWFHRCVYDAEYNFRTQPMQCAGGSSVGYHFTAGDYNPCTINFDTNYGWECLRGSESSNTAPTCYTDGSVTCYNGGTLVHQAERCWCLCTPDWQGDFDCSKPTGYNPSIPAGGSICVDGEPDADWCAIYDGCLNQGQCFNQCQGFWCLCPRWDLYNYLGKRCELYDN